jgi:hypothetical protein
MKKIILSLLQREGEKSQLIASIIELQEVLIAD